MFNLDERIMKKRLIIVLCLFVIILTSGVRLNAQVSIGGDSSKPPQPPKSFSILELISVPAINVGGLRLPQLTEQDKSDINSKLTDIDNKDAGRGLFIYNIEKGCIEYWNGEEWIAPLSIDTLPWQISLGSPITKSVATVTDSIYHTGVVSIGTKDTDPSAILNVQSGNKGVLLPQVTLTDASDRATIENPATGLLVYNTGSDPNFPTVGYMFWDGSAWRLFANASSEPATATLNCEAAAMNPSQQIIDGTPLTAGTLLQIPYSGSNGGNFKGVAINSSNGGGNITATIESGTLALGNGVLSLLLSGTPTLEQQAPNGIKFSLNDFLAANRNIAGCSSGVTVGNVLSASISSVAVMGNLMLTADDTNNDDPSGPAYGASSYQLMCNSPDGKFSFRVNVPGNVNTIQFGTQSINVQVRNNQDAGSSVIWNASVQWGSTSDYGGAGVLTIPSKRWGGQNGDRGGSWTDYTTNSTSSRWGNIGIYDATTQGPEYRRYTWIPLGPENKVSYEVHVMAALDTLTPGTAVSPTLLKVYIKFDQVTAQ